MQRRLSTAGNRQQARATRRANRKWTLWKSNAISQHIKQAAKREKDRERDIESEREGYILSCNSCCCCWCCHRKSQTNFEANFARAGRGCSSCSGIPPLPLSPLPPWRGEKPIISATRGECELSVSICCISECTHWLHSWTAASRMANQLRALCSQIKLQNLPPASLYPLLLLIFFYFFFLILFLFSPRSLAFAQKFFVRATFAQFDFQTSWRKKTTQLSTFHLFSELRVQVQVGVGVELLFSLSLNKLIQ